MDPIPDSQTLDVWSTYLHLASIGGKHGHLIHQPHCVPGPVWELGAEMCYFCSSHAPIEKLLGCPAGT